MDIDEEYRKESGTSNDDGHVYEQRMCALSYLKALHKSDIVDFRIATNFECFDKSSNNTDGQKGHDFADVGFQYFKKNTVDSSINEEHLILFQMKHLQSTYISTFNLTSTAKKNRTLSLPLYYKWVQALWASQKSVFPGNNFQDATFALFTNAEMDKNDKELGDNILWYYDDFFTGDDTGGSSSSTQCQLGYYFVINETYTPILEKLEGDDREEKKRFLRQLRIYSSQPAAKDIDNVVKKELFKSFSLRSVQESECLYPRFMEVVRSWWIRKRKARFLKPAHGDDLHKAARVYQIVYEIENTTTNIVDDLDKIARLGFTFKDDDDIVTGCTDHSFFNFATTCGTTHMTCLKLCQNLNLTRNDFVCVKLDTIVNSDFSDILKVAWCKTNKPILIILCDTNPGAFNIECLFPLFYEEKTYNYFCDFNFDAKLERKLFFVDLPPNSVELLQTNFKGSNSFISLPVASSFEALDPHSQGQIMEQEIVLVSEDNSEKCVKFKDVNFENIQKVKENMNISVLWWMLQNKKITVFQYGKNNWSVSCPGENEMYPLVFQAVDVVENISTVVGKEFDRYNKDIVSVKATPAAAVDYLKERITQQFGQNELGDTINEYVDKVLNTNLLDLLTNICNQADKNSKKKK